MSDDETPPPSCPAAPEAALPEAAALESARAEPTLTESASDAPAPAVPAPAVPAPAVPALKDAACNAAALREASLHLDMAGALLGPGRRPDDAGAILAASSLRNAARLAVEHGKWSGDLPRALTAARLRPAQERAVRTLLDGGQPDNFATAEVAVTHLVMAASERTSVPSLIRRYQLAAMVAVLAAAALLIGFVVRAQPSQRPSDAYHFKASSAEAPYPQEGQLGDHGPFELVFHTKNESDPWVIIDLGETRKISKVSLLQRSDCCKDRGVPLVVEVGDESQTFVEVASRKEPFAEWTAKFPPQSARYVKLRATKRTYLHLRDVFIR